MTRIMLKPKKLTIENLTRLLKRRGTGYKGHSGLFEVLDMNDKIKSLIN